MGYETDARGRLIFDEPLIFKAFRSSPWRVANNTGRGQQHDVRLVEESDTVDTDDGQLVVTRAVGIEPTWDTGKHYTLEKDLQALLDSLPYVPVISGHLEISGTWPDGRRLYVRDGRVIAVSPLIVWQLGDLDLPDETVQTRWDSQ